MAGAVWAGALRFYPLLQALSYELEYTSCDLNGLSYDIEGLSYDHRGRVPPYRLQL